MRKFVFLGSLPFFVLVMVGPSAGVPVYLPLTGHYYEYRADVQTWSNAVGQAWSSSFVDSAGMYWAGYLATVTSAEEDQFLSNAFLEEGWLGGGDGDLDGAWVWETGSETGWVFWDNGQTLLYANWAAGEPSANPEEKCVLKRALQDGGGTWEAEDPMNLHAFFVEYEPVATATPEGIDVRSWGAIKSLFLRSPVE